MHTRRWGWIATMAAVLMALWVGSQRGGDVLAAAIRATDAAPAIHIVGRGSQGTEIEAWFVADSGYFVHLNEQGRERILVDDRQRRYEYDPQGKTVEIRPSRLGDAQAARIRDFYTGTSILKDLQRRHAARDVRVDTAVWAGRSLRRLTVRGDRQTIYVDPKTDRVALIEERGSHAHPATELLRYEMDYPDPSTVDRGRFRFDIPAGATVKDRTEELSGIPATPEQQMSRAREEVERARRQLDRLRNPAKRR